MTKQGYGSMDKDRVGKEKTDRPLKGPGTDPALSAKIGGVGAGPPMANARKGGAKKGSKPFPFGNKKPT